jgi:hypothetical protein
LRKERGGLPTEDENNSMLISQLCGLNRSENTDIKILKKYLKVTSDITPII